MSISLYLCKCPGLCQDGAPQIICYDYYATCDMLLVGSARSCLERIQHMPILAVAALAYSTGQLVHSFVTSVVLHVTGGTGRVTPEGDTEHA